MKKLAAVALLSSLAFTGAAMAQNVPNQSAVNSDASKPNSPLKERGIPDSGQFNPTGPGARPAPAPAVVVPAPAPARAPAVAPAPAPVAAPVPAPAPIPAPAPAPRAPRADRG